jgi:hypothetical protein
MAGKRGRGGELTMSDLIIGTLALALVAGTGACHQSEATSAAPRRTVSAQNAAIAPLLPSSVDAMPSFDVAKYRTLLEQLHGTPVVVNIWSSYGDRIQFLGVDIQDTRSAAAAFIKEFDWRYPSVFDSSGQIRDELGFVGQPETIFIDSSGRALSNWSGPLTPEALQRNLARILEG